MSIKLFFEVMFKFLLGVILVGILIFIPAGSFMYFNGWLLMILLFIPMFLVGLLLLFKNPQLLKDRLKIKEKENDQKSVVLTSALMFICGFVVAGLNYRFNWIHLPNWFVIISSFTFILSYILYAEVLRENSFLLRTIEVKYDQKLIDSGLYKIVRHPMYMSTIFLFLSMPLVLDSLISFIIFLIYPFIIVKRIHNEEIILEKDLDGYKEYKSKVRYRLIPFIW